MFLQGRHIRSYFVLIHYVLLLDRYLLRLCRFLQLVKLLLTLLQLTHQALDNLVLDLQLLPQILGIRTSLLHCVRLLSWWVDFRPRKMLGLKLLLFSSQLLLDLFVVNNVVFILTRGLFWDGLGFGFWALGIAVLESWLCRTVFQHELALRDLTLGGQLFGRTVAHLLLGGHLDKFLHNACVGVVVSHHAFVHTLIIRYLALLPTRDRIIHHKTT